ncbi:unnamed protein product [Prunus armeniaca]
MECTKRLSTGATFGHLGICNDFSSEGRFNCTSLRLYRNSLGVCPVLYSSFQLQYRFAVSVIAWWRCIVSLSTSP